MAKESRNLYFFTATYPYGQRESFIEDEIVYLSKAFKRITIIPLKGSGNPTRLVPNNCEVIPPIIRSIFQQYLIGLFCPLALKIFASDFFNKRVYRNKKRFETWLIAYVISNNLLMSPRIRNIFKNISKEDVCYFYWGKGSNNLSFFYRGKATYVCRFHGEWDLWEESSGNYAPIRTQITKSLNLAILISEKGMKYFKQRYPNCKTALIPLGSNDCGVGFKSNDNTIRVLSCSSVYWLKRVPLIFRALKNIKDKNVIWTHIGDGEDFEKLKKEVSNSIPQNITVNLLGRLPHPQVLEYYQNNPVDVFVNVSTNEGVPVSIMEAISFDVPVVATDVGSNSEIVTPQSGVLISSMPSDCEIADAILKAMNLATSPRNFWSGHYSAENNYRKIVNALNNPS